MNVGHVYVIHTVLARPPKDKITICISAAENLFFWVNTKPRRHGIGQLALVAEDHSALTHDCFLDCSRVTTFAGVELAAAQHRGAISPVLARRIVQLLETDPPKTLPPRYIKLVIENLRPMA